MIKYIVNYFLVGILLAIPYQGTSSIPKLATPLSGVEPENVQLMAATGMEIEFSANNGRAVDGILPEIVEIPHLVLHRNGGLTSPEERTLMLAVGGLSIPSSGVTLTLTIETEHGDPDFGGGNKHRIPVWRESRWVASPSDIAVQATTISFVHEFQENLAFGNNSVSTPTGYFRYEVIVTDGLHPFSDPLYLFRSEFAFLMEDQWVVDLPEVREESQGAAPDELIIYYADMIPYRLGVHNHSSQLLREDVPGYIQAKLIPPMVEAFRLQTDEWGFTWHQEWTSYRLQDAERSSVALTGKGVWYHGRTPRTAHAGISINTSARDYSNYDNLATAITSVFHHELFHSMQRNINQAHGGNGKVSGMGDTLAFFAEGMALLASTVGQQDVEFLAPSGVREYFSKANVFIAGNEFYTDNLNVSYADMDPYLAALYWRFLYEQCGYMGAIGFDSSAGMRVIRRTLEVLYSQVAGNDAQEDLITILPYTMDKVFQSSGMESCPFDTYENSVVKFARAIFSLRLEGGRCEAIGNPAGCGLYDPAQLYEQPAVEKIHYTGASQSYSGTIPSSFGMDFVDVILDSGAATHPIQIEIASQPEARFSLQLIPLVDPDSVSKLRLTHSRPIVQETVVGAGQDGRLCYAMAELDLDQDNRLGLIITRLDTHEKLDHLGSYDIGIHTVTGCRFSS
jgi:hypothetical protein